MRSCMDWRSVTFDWNRARAFLVTAEEGSFSAAARALGISQPTVGRQVAALEDELDVTLFERVGSGLALTEAGADLVEHVRAMGEAANRVSLTAAGRATTIAGPVIIAASEVAAAHTLPPLIADIRARYPAVQVEIVASTGVSDLQRREADIAVRNFRPQAEGLVARKVAEDRARLYATPGYLQSIGDPQTPAALSRADFIGFDKTPALMQGLNALGLSLTLDRFVLVSGNQLAQWALCKAGLGVAIMPESVADADPAVVRALESLPPFPVPIWLTTHRELRTSRRIRAVFDLLAAGLAERLGGDAGR